MVWGLFKSAKLFICVAKAKCSKNMAKFMPLQENLVKVCEQL